MSVVACVVGDSPGKLWGIDGRERLARQLRALGIACVQGDGGVPASLVHAEGDPAPTVLALRGDHLYDDRVLAALVSRPGVVLVASADEERVIVGVHAAAGGEAAVAVLLGSEVPEALGGATIESVGALVSSWSRTLLKAEPAAVLEVRAGSRADLERHLFDGAYKGVTDLVTKWLWPAPARAATRACVRLGVTPNMVTSASWVLAVAAGALFASGAFAPGLALAWTMTFLDTVDGKLARVTVTSTRAGHFFDHVLDLVHPPLWYLAWAMGAGFAPDAFPWMTTVLVAGYVAGRLVEGAFDTLLAGFPIFTWKPVDSWLRLVVARRNPNLLLLTGFAAAGMHAEGFVAVVAWTVVSSLLLVTRLAQATAMRLRGRAPTPWLADIEPCSRPLPAWARPFACRAPFATAAEGEARG